MRRPMRIAFVARWNAGHESGILKKIMTQVSAALAAGHDARLFLLSDDPAPAGLLRVPAEMFITGRIWQREWRMARLARAVHAWRPDVIYLRYESHFVGLEWLAHRYPTVLEVNTDDMAEYPLYLPRYRWHYHRATRGRLLSRAAGFVCVTRELAGRFGRAGAPAAVIANGINLSAIPEPGPPPPATDGRTRLVFLGAPGSPWHGVDEIVAAARNAPDWQVDLIGWTDSSGLPGNVRAHGVMTYEQYGPMLAQADVAVGSVGIYRRPRMNECSPLKVREYLAHGLPVVIGYDDTDFSSPVPYVLQIPNEPGNVARSIEKIRKFAARWRGKRVARTEIRHLDATSKEAVRLAFLGQIAEGNHRTAQ